MKGRIEEGIRKRGGLLLKKQVRDANLKELLDKVHEIARATVELCLAQKEFTGEAMVERIEVGIIKNTQINGYVHCSRDRKRYFIGIYLGATLRPFNIILESLAADIGFLGYWTEGEFNHIDSSRRGIVDGSIKAPESVVSMIETFRDYHCDTMAVSSMEIVEELVLHIVEFLVAHELAHVLRRHLDYLHQTSSLKSLSVFDEIESMAAFEATSHAKPGISDHRLLRKKLRGVEADADMQAVFLGYRILEVAVRGSDEIKSRMVADLFLRCFSIGVFLMLVDNERELTKQYTDHPPSYVRYLYIQDYIRRYHEFETELDSQEHDQEYLVSLMEIENLAILLGYREGRWVRKSDRDAGGNYLDISREIDEPYFVTEDENITRVSNEIDGMTDVCFIDGAAEYLDDGGNAEE
ncbi:MAG: hypothetical protein AAGG48_26935 [Planctomycetota bacterium]